MGIRINTIEICKCDDRTLLKELATMKKRTRIIYRIGITYRTIRVLDDIGGKEDDYR
jgi:hypothetical protein